MTYLELQTEVRQNVIDLPTTVTNRVPTLVKRAIKDLQTRHNFKVMEETAEFTTTVNVRSIGNVPADFKEWRLNPFFLEENGAFHQLSIAPNERATRLAFDEILDTGPPFILIESEPSSEANATTLSVYPLPDGNSDYANGEYRIKVPYFKYLADLAADGSTNWFTNNAEKFIIYQATAEAFLADWDEQRMGVWLQLADGEFNKIVKRDKLYRLGGVDTLIPNRDVNYPRLRI